jgi:RHS repeat-associated protein
VTLGLQATVVENGVRETYSARYYNPNTGRFMSRDPENPDMGRPNDPKTLHKYLYAGGDPVNATDPNGRGILIQRALFIASMLGAAAIQRAQGMDPNTVVASLICGGEKVATWLNMAITALNAALGSNAPGIPDGLDLGPFEQWCAAWVP